MAPASPQLKKGQVKLGHVLELPLDTSVSRLFPGLVGREAWTAEFDGALLQEDSTATPLSMLLKLKC